MVVVVEVVLGCVDCIGLVLAEEHTATDDFVVPVLVVLHCLLAYLLDSLDEAVVVAIGVVLYDAHPAVDLDYLLPVG